MPGRRCLPIRHHTDVSVIAMIGLALPWLAAPPLALGSAAQPAPVASRIVCRDAIQHPIRIRVEALDPVRPFEVTRLRLEVSSTTALEAVRARVAGTGAASMLSPREVTRAALGPGRTGVFEFRVRVPAERTVIQFRVEGEGSGGRLARGAVYNLVPGGPVEKARQVSRDDGTPVLEVTARRIGS